MHRCRFHYPKPFTPVTTANEDGYPSYRRRAPGPMDDGRTADKDGISYNNQFVVPYNPWLLLKYRSHINVEVCHESVTFNACPYHIMSDIAIPLSCHESRKDASTFNARRMQVCASIKSIKYLHDYMMKGPSMAKVVISIVIPAPLFTWHNIYRIKSFSPSSHCVMQIRVAPADGNDDDCTDEIQDFINCRELGACEAAWRLLGFPIHGQAPSTERLEIDLEGHERVTLHPGADVQQALDARQPTKLEAFFTLCNDSNDTLARTLLYREVPQHYTWQATRPRHWKRRVLNSPAIGRICSVLPSESIVSCSNKGLCCQSLHSRLSLHKKHSCVVLTHKTYKGVNWYSFISGYCHSPISPYFSCTGKGELFYMRMLLGHVRGPRSHDDLKTVDGVVCQTYREACFKQGLLRDDAEWHE